jgi:rhodanese-related sulfurtransferase
MEFQLRCRTTVRKLTARDLKKWLEIEGGVLLDARENWERQWGVLPHSHPLDPVKLEEILQTYPKDTPLVVYCHYGVRSMDAATYLADQGFKNVQTLAGGVEAWSMQVDPSFPRYPGHPC